jgi:hypothetical protein
MIKKMIQWAKGYGWADSAEKRPVTIHTLFQAEGWKGMR